MIRALILCATVILLGACSGSAPLYHDLDGRTLRFADLRGRWVVINYWAIWCAPCRAEIPELNELARREGERLQLLGVNFDLPPVDQLRRQAARLGVEFPVLLEDPAREFGYARPDVLPTTYLIGPDGDLAGQLVGPQTVASIAAAIANRTRNP